MVIIRYSIILWAMKRAVSSRFGTLLGLGDVNSVHWVARRGMHWGQLLPLMKETLTAYPPTPGTRHSLRWKQLNPEEHLVLDGSSL